jgi:hypothetical protein
MKAIVTLACGNKYQKRFQQYCYANWKAYADRHGLGLLVYEDLLDHSPRALSRSPAWQKCLVIQAETCHKYDQVVWIDADIVINSTTAPHVFEGISANEIGAVKDFDYPSRDKYRERLGHLYQRWEALGIKYVRNLTPQEFMMNWGLPPTKDVVQTGVLVASPEIHGPLFKRTYDVYEDKGEGMWNYEMRPLSYELLTGSTVKWLDPRFNVITSFGVRDEDLNSFQGVHGPFEPALCHARQLKVTDIHKRLFEDSYFLHFAGRQRDMVFLTPPA